MHEKRTHREVIDHVAQRTHATAADVSAVLTALTEVITEELASGHTVTITGLGTFETRARAARTGRNPRTGEAMEIAATTTPAFKPGAVFKRGVVSSS